MSEIPKLEVIESYYYEFDNLDEKLWYNFNIHSIDVPNESNLNIITFDSLKEVNASWDKYKDNEKLFSRDYPREYECYLEHLFLNRANIHNDLNWYSWLHDKLYKVE